MTPENAPASPPHATLDALPPPAQAAVRAYFEQCARPDDHRPITVAWAPGRVNLIGEHTDYNDGWALPVAVDRVVAVAGRPHADRPTALYSLHHDQRRTLPTDDVDVETPISGGPLWARLARAVTRELAREAGGRGPAIPQFSAVIAGDVPVGGGMGSSAAYEVALATFVADLGGTSFPALATARLCQRAEWAGAGVQVGVLDQAASCLGRAGHALLLDCRSLAYEYIPVRLAGVALVVFDTRVPRSLAGAAYNERRAQCDEAVSLLAGAITRDEPARDIRALRDITLSDLARSGDALPELLLRRARHVVSENARVLEAASALRAGDAEHLGRLLSASHASLREDYAVSCPELYAAAAIAATVPGVLGARMMGAGFGGSVLILARGATRAGLDDALRREYPRRTG
ncbi:MAG: galactokinase, partial [Ktedonobacterales bacterium]